MSTPIAMVRGVASTFAECVTERRPEPPLDVDTARSQHDSYVRLLEASGFSVRSIPPDDDHPDCCFVEDTAVVVDDVALLTRPGHPSRAGEVAAVGAALRELVEVEEMAEPATLDGGDVLQVGSTVFVGVGARTNREGFESLRRLAAARGRRVVAVETRGVLHLKSAATALDDDTVLVDVRAVPTSVFEGLRVVEVPVSDGNAANVVRLADGAILAASHQDGTALLLSDAGYRVVTTDVGEFARADGGLTCLSIRLRHRAP
jgi:dimethylargininase